MYDNCIDDQHASPQREWFICVELTDRSESLLNRQRFRADLIKINDQKPFVAFNFLQIFAIELKQTRQKFS